MNKCIVMIKFVSLVLWISFLFAISSSRETFADVPSIEDLEAFIGAWAGIDADGTETILSPCEVVIRLLTIL